jgi:hypothetical protein
VHLHQSALRSDIFDCSLGITLRRRYKYVTLAGHDISRALQICHTRWVDIARVSQLCHTRWTWHCAGVTNMSHSLGITLRRRHRYVTPAGHDIARVGKALRRRYKYITLAGHGIAHALQICHTRWTRQRASVTNICHTLLIPRLLLNTNLHLATLQS